MFTALRVGWVALPATVGPAVAHALSAASAPVQITAATLCWLAWGVGLVAVLVPRTVSLTVMRIAAPASFAVAVIAAVRSSVGVGEVIALGWTAALAALVLFVPIVTDTFVDGSSYGPERRYALRVPGALVLGPVELTWAAVVAGVAVGPLLLAARSWVAGAVATAAGVVAVWFGGRALHRLSQRWAVFTSAGLVLHDQVILGEVILFLKATIRSLAPAEAATTATDVTGRALGLVLELQLDGSSKVRGADTDRLLFSPVRPGAVLQEARSRGLAASPPPITSSPR